MQFEFFFTPPPVSSAKISLSLKAPKHPNLENTPLMFFKDSSVKLEMLVVEILMKPA